jgi:lipid-A-disaccharide synthase-like uncharacterized protein
VEGEVVVLWILGTAGIVAMESSYLPQIVRLYRRKRAHDMSAFFPALNVFGRLLALGYSLVRNDHVFVWGFLFGMMVRALLLGQVVLYKWRPGVVDPDERDAEAAREKASPTEGIARLAVAANVAREGA